jgi:hypothetical protein
MARCLPVVGVLLLLFLTACTTSIETRHRDWSQYDGPGAQYFHQEEVPFIPLLADPYEPMNRGTSGFNDWVYRNLLDPLGKGWRFVFGASVRKRIGKFGTNLEFPVRGVNNLVQGKFGNAGTETSRFLINTTVGLLGFFDPADSWGLKAPAPLFRSSFYQISFCIILCGSQFKPMVCKWIIRCFSSQISVANKYLCGSKLIKCWCINYILFRFSITFYNN